jgi:hypothetical protein
MPRDMRRADMKGVTQDLTVYTAEPSHTSVDRKREQNRQLNSARAQFLGVPKLARH